MIRPFASANRAFSALTVDGVMGLRKLSPGGYEYLTGSVACGDRELAPGESLADYYFAHGYPPGEWVGAGAELLGVSGEVSQSQMTALFGEGRHPNADAIEARMITDEGASPTAALEATKLGNRFGRYGGLDDLRAMTGAAYKDYNTSHHRPVGAPIDAETRARIRHGVLRDAFAKAHHDRQPNDEKELNEWLAKQKAQRKCAVAGYEMVFAPPKSVSVAWALADAPTQQLIESMHRQAVRDSLRYFETHAAYTRHGRNGIAQVDIDGVIAATFEHWDSRTGDPHLHTHVPISNKVRRSLDGHWTSLDGRTVFAANVPVSEFYNSRIRDLFREHGATWTAKTTTRDSTKQPVWELDGIPEMLLTAFSQRTSQVETERARLIVQFRNITGREPDPRELLELSRRAKLSGRPTKQAPISLAEHRAGWRQLAIQHTSTTTVEGIRNAVFPHAGATADVLESPDETSLAQLAGVVVRSVQARHTRFNRWHLQAEAHRATADLAVSPQRREQLVGRLVDLAVRAEGTVCLEPPTLVTEPAILRRRDGSSVFVEHNTIRYTTLATLHAEEALVAHARRFGGARVSERNLRAAIRAEAKTGATLNAGQRALVTAFAASGRRLQLALAPAGSGKTTAMRVLAESWRASGGRVFAFGPSARAAHELGESIHARPRTLHQLTHALDRGRGDRAFRFRRGDLLIIDEAVMAGTHTLHRVVDYALARGADVRLVGDDHQLGAVEAGGAVALIASDVGAERLHQIVRFTDPAQAVASLHVRAGNPDGLTYYKDRGWIAGGSRETMRDAAHHAWRTDLDRGHHALLIVPTIDDVVALNLQARALRLDRGHVDPHDTITLHDGTLASRGDYIVTRFNNRRLTLPATATADRTRDGGRDFVKNGDTWRVLRVGTNGSLTVTRTDSSSNGSVNGGSVGGGTDRRVRAVRRETITLPAAYVAAHVELAYAATVNRVQGMNCHSGHAVIPPGLTREQFYTLTSRGRESNKL
jgi:conjugative relaxase-like TrwC/TraI family protein